MKAKMKMVAMLVTSILALTSCAGSNMTDQLAQTWYAENDDEAAFTLYDDGTCKVANEYGTGTWDIVNDNQLKLTNFYGKSQIASIISVEKDCLTLGSGDETAVFYNTPQQEESSENVITYSSQSYESESTSLNENASQITQTKETIYYGNYPFYNGVAWVNYENKYYDENGDFLKQEYFRGVIDKNGKILFQFNSKDISINAISNFANEYAHILTETKSYIIDKTGNITSSYNIDENTQVLAYGEGYTFVAKYISGFDTSETQYTIYDANGNIATEFEYPGQPVIRATYCGKGIF